MSFIKVLKSLLTFFSIVILTTCGGGGVSSEQVTIPPTPAPTPEPTPAPTPELSGLSINACFDGECFDILQIQGAEQEETNGGSASNQIRTIYGNINDQEDKSDYEGSNWPYVITRKDITTIELPSNISLEIFDKNSEDQILINGKPAYQYKGDSLETDIFGNGIDDLWYVFKINGDLWTPEPTPEPTPPPQTNSAPYFVYEDIERFPVEINQSKIGTILATDPDGDPLEFSITGNEIEISNTGEMSFKDSSNQQNNWDDSKSKSNNSSSARFYKELVTVSDGRESVSKYIYVSITYGSIILLEHIAENGNPNTGPNFSGLSGDGNTIVFFENFRNNKPEKCTIGKYVSGAWSYNDVSETSDYICKIVGPTNAKSIDFSGNRFSSSNSSFENNTDDYIFELENNILTKLGNRIPNSRIGDDTPSLSSDGSRVCIANKTAREGYFEVYEFTEGEWNIVGSRVEVNEPPTNNIQRCMISHDNNHVIIGSSRSRNSNGSRGFVKVFRQLDDDWVQVEEKITPSESGNTEFGSEFAINEDGSVVAVSHGDINYGYEVFEKTATGWSRKGSILKSSRDRGRRSTSFSMNKSGNRIAIIGNNECSSNCNTSAERLLIFDYFEGEWWQVLDTSLARGNPGNSGENVIQMSDDGNTIAFSGRDWQVIRLNSEED